MERLDQGHLHAKLVILRLTCLDQESNPASGQWEASSLAQIYSNIVFIAIWNIYCTYEPATWLFPKIHEHKYELH